VQFYRYDPGSKKWTGEALHVAERYRRQGVATAMYDWFRQKFGPIRPSDAQTRDGKSFWQGKRVWEQGVTEAQGEIKLGPQLFVSRQTTTEDIKPRGVAWTSTAQKTPQGFTSDWIEWCKDNMAQWVTDTGILYDVAPGARILLLRTDRDVIRVARRYGLEIKNSFDLFEKMDWDVLRQDYDAVHHIPQGRSLFMSAWDVESTAWFDRKFLTNPRRVKVDTGKTHDIGETSKPGVAESLDQPYRIKWERSPFGDLDAIATLEDGSNLLIMFNNEADQWRVEFYRGDRQDITGEGDAQRIFATVLKAIREFIRRKKPTSIVFGSVKEIDPRGSRTRLYDRMVQRYATDLGYTLQRQQDSSHTVYRLNRDAQTVAEGIDPGTYEELDARIIARAAKRIVPTARARRTPEGYVHVTTEDGLDLYIGAGVADGSISVNIGSGGGVTTSGAHKGAVTDIIRGVYLAAVRKYGEPDTPGELTIDHDAGHGVWQHIANKLGLRYAAVEVKESGMAEGRISDLDIDLQDQQWEAVVGRVEHGVRRGEDPDRMSLALYQWATGEMFDMDEELERRGFGSVADLADHIRDHGGRYVPPEFDLSAGGSIKDLERLPRRRPDDVSEATSEPDFMRGHCHVMALALLTLHPDWQLRAHIGWDEDAESDRDYRVDHVYVMAPDGTAYDCRGRFASEQELVGPDETGGAETQFIDYDISRVRADVARGELRPFSRRDLEQARAFARRLAENFADGRKPGRKGLSKRVGIPRKATLGQLEKIARSSTGERRRMAQWQLNMRRGQKKNK
jgi:opacity protein-like surface antigen